MRIGILSLVLHTNYGGILQSYALQTTLERMGHEVVVLDKNRDISCSFCSRFTGYTRYCISRFVFGRNVKYVEPQKINAERCEREQYTRDFINKYINTRMVDEIKRGVFSDMDAIIVGSDQVWRPMYFKKKWETTMDNAFLQFQKQPNIKRIAYAASFGTDEWEYSEEETRQCSHLIQSFKAVSVREKSGIELCRRYLGYKTAKHVLDPTFLLSYEDYETLVKSSNTPKSSGLLMCYVLDMTEEKQDLINSISNERGLVPFYTNSKIKDKNAPQKERIQPAVESWIRGFLDAEFVITDSFHACVFSIIFHKPFIVVGNKQRGQSRFDSLLAMFSLNDHLIMTPKDYLPFKDYSVNALAYERLQEYQRFSLEFLSDALK